MANLYNLKVLFKSGFKWNLFIIAEDITWLPCWYSDRPKYDEAIEVEMKLLKSMVSHAKGAKGIDEEEAKKYLVD